MRLSAVLSLSFLLAGGCTGTHPVEITPATLEGGPRYKLTYLSLPAANVDPRVIDQVGLVLQQELAARGLLLAAPWETPTLEVRFGLRGPNGEHFDVRQDGFTNSNAWLSSTLPVSYTRGGSEFDAASPVGLSTTSGTLRRRRTIGVEIREIGTPHVITSAVSADNGEWTRSGTVGIRPLVQETLARLTL